MRRNRALVRAGVFVALFGAVASGSRALAGPDVAGGAVPVHANRGPGWLDIGEAVLAVVVIAAVAAVFRYRSRLRPILLAGETRYLGLVESAPFGVVVHAEGRVLHVNLQARQLFGLAPEAPLPGLDLDHLAPAADAPPAGHPFEPLTTSTKGLMPVARLRRADGSLLEVQILTITTEFREREARLTFIRDVTAEMATQRALEENRERLAVALEAARDGVWDLDLATGRLGHNAAFGAVIAPGGPVPGDVPAWRDLIHPGDRERLEAAISRHEQEHTDSYECEMRVRRPDGTDAWVLEHGRVAARSGSGAPQRLVGTVRDVTSRKRAERRLEMRSRLAETVMATRGEALRSTVGELLRELLEAPCSCVGMYDRNGRLRLACNCHPLADGSVPDLLLAPESVPAALQQVLDAHAPLCLTETGGGTDAPRAPLLGVRLAAGGRVLGLIAVGGRAGGYRQDDIEALAGIAEDLGPLVLARMETEAVDAQLAQAQKTEALGVMAGGIAHDFNNILQAIMGFSSLARQDAGDPVRLAADLDRVQKATTRGHELVQRILQFSRSEEPETGTLDPAPVVQDLAMELAASVPAHITVECRVAAECGRVRVGAQPLRQILRNLAQNARQAMEATGGQLTIVARPVTVDAADPRFTPEWLGREVLELAITDTGPGIPEAHRSRIFDPFFTTREVGQGTGMGLPVVYGLVTAVGGRVHLESPVGGGTVVSVFLPRLPVVGRPAEPDTTVLPQMAGAGRRVLFVDDEEEIRELAVVLLGRAGFQVEAVADGFAAVERITADPQAFDVVVTDQYMPGLTGRELARKVADVRPGLPVVLVTGMNEVADAPGGGPGLFREVVTKPFTGPALVLAACRAAGVTG